MIKGKTFMLSLLCTGGGMPKEYLIQASSRKRFNISARQNITVIDIEGGQKVSAMAKNVL